MRQHRTQVQWKRFKYRIALIRRKIKEAVMSKTHWKKLNNPDYLGAYALEPGQELVATIKVVEKKW